MTGYIFKRWPSIDENFTGSAIFVVWNLRNIQPLKNTRIGTIHTNYEIFIFHNIPTPRHIVRYGWGRKGDQYVSGGVLVLGTY